MAFYPVAPLPDLHARQPVVTIRQPSTALFTVDSEDRFKRPNEAAAAALLPPTQTNVTPYDFTISKNESLMNGFFTRVGITEVNFPFAIPNINVKTNKIIINWDNNDGNAGTETLEMDNNFYTPNDIAGYLQTIIRAADPILADVSFNWAIGNDPSFFYEAPTDLTISFAPLPYNSAAYPWPDTTRQLFHLLGMTDDNKRLRPSGFSNFTFCQFTRYLDIVCYQLTNNQALKDQTSQFVARDMLCRLYLGDGNLPCNINAGDAAFIPPGCAPFTIYRDFSTPKQIQWIPNQPIPGFLRFEIFDDTGAPINEALTDIIGANVNAGAGYLDWSMTMQVSEC